MIKTISKSKKHSNYINHKCVSIQHESNYYQLKLILPEMKFDRYKSSNQDQPTLQLDVLHRFKYTTEIRLKYHFAHSESESIVIRIYEDAKVAELTYCTDFQKFVRRMGVNISPKIHFKTRVSLNRFLQKWLNFLLKNNYRSKQWSSIE